MDVVELQNLCSLNWCVVCCDTWPSVFSHRKTYIRLHNNHYTSIYVHNEKTAEFFDPTGDLPDLNTLTRLNNFTKSTMNTRALQNKSTNCAMFNAIFAKAKHLQKSNEEFLNLFTRSDLCLKTLKKIFHHLE
jgi:hypothetical protein